MHWTFLHRRRDRRRAGEPYTTLLTDREKLEAFDIGYIHNLRARLARSVSPVMKHLRAARKWQVDKARNVRAGSTRNWG
jgi:hypothetical protein